jgi:S1-C subfamily serine protease
MIKHRFCYVAVVAAVLCAAAVWKATANSADDSPAEEAFAKMGAAIVVVRTRASQGSGVIVGMNEVATNCHIIENGRKIWLARALSKGEFGTAQVIEAKLAYSDFSRDVCLLAASGISGQHAPPIRAAKTLKAGESVYAIGAPQGLEYSISAGIVSQLRALGDAPQMIQTDAAISPGSSGGGLFDAQGNLVGLTTRYKSEEQNLNFAAPVEWIADARKMPAENITQDKTQN